MAPPSVARSVITSSPLPLAEGTKLTTPNLETESRTLDSPNRNLETQNRPLEAPTRNLASEIYEPGLIVLPLHLERTPTTTRMTRAGTGLPVGPG